VTAKTTCSCAPGLAYGGPREECGMHGYGPPAETIGDLEDRLQPGHSSLSLRQEHGYYFARCQCGYWLDCLSSPAAALGYFDRHLRNIWAASLLAEVAS
jgi:hypothetical protein